jgi:hypothetical protein
MGGGLIYKGTVNATSREDSESLWTGPRRRYVSGQRMVNADLGELHRGVDVPRG